MSEGEQPPSQHRDETQEHPTEVPKAVGVAGDTAVGETIKQIPVTSDERVDFEKGWELAHTVKSERDDAAESRAYAQVIEDRIQNGDDRHRPERVDDLKRQAQELDREAEKIEDKVAVWVDILREHPLSEETKRLMPHLYASGLAFNQIRAERMLEEAEKIEAAAPAIALDLVFRGYRAEFSIPLFGEKEVYERKVSIGSAISNNPELMTKMEAIVSDPSATVQSLKDFYVEVILSNFVEENRVKAKGINDELNNIRNGLEPEVVQANHVEGMVT